MPAVGSPCLKSVMRSWSVRDGTRPVIAGPSSPPLPSLPWQPAQRLTNACWPGFGLCASATDADSSRRSENIAVRILGQPAFSNDAAAAARELERQAAPILDRQA